MFGNINLYNQTVLLKLIYGFWIGMSFMDKQKFFDFSKTPFRYVFSIAMSVFLRDFWEKVLVSQGCVQSEVTVQTL